PSLASMADAIAVLNAGSSSIKFALFVDRDGELELEARGQIEELHAAPRFVARSATGDVEAEASWTELGHGPALDHLLPFLRRRFVGHRLLGVGHRVVHGGPARAEPARVAPELLDELESLVPLAPLHQPHNLAAVRLLCERAPDL